MRRDTVWSVLFSFAIAVLMLAILLARNVAPPLWVLITYPAIGAVLAQVASRTCPNRRQIAWLETGSIAAACVVILVGLVNLLLVELFIRNAYSDAAAAGRIADNISYVVLPAISVLLWWALGRRIKRLRQVALEEVAVRVGETTHTKGHGDAPQPIEDAEEAAPSESAVAIELSKHAA